MLVAEIEAKLAEPKQLKDKADRKKLKDKLRAREYVYIITAIDSSIFFRKRAENKKKEELKKKEDEEKAVRMN